MAVRHTDVFLDVGCSTGEPCIAVAVATPVQAVYGIEIMPDRCQSVMVNPCCLCAASGVLWRDTPWLCS